MSVESLVLDDKRFNFWQVPDLVSRRRAIRWCKVAATSTTLGRLTRNDLFALLSRNQLTHMTFVAFLTTLFSFLSRRWLSFWLGVRMFCAGRQGRVSRSQFLNLILKLPDSFFQLTKRGQDERFDGRRHLGFDFCWYFDQRLRLAHMSIGAENADSSPARFPKNLHQPVNGYRCSSRLS